jgi:hypothetical protein
MRGKRKRLIAKPNFQKNNAAEAKDTSESKQSSNLALSNNFGYQVSILAVLQPVFIFSDTLIT